MKTATQSKTRNARKSQKVYRGRDYKALLLRPTGYAVMPLINEILRLGGVWNENMKYGKNNRHVRHLAAVKVCQEKRGLYDRAVAAYAKKAADKSGK